jgi:hypothetical protein
VISSVLNVHAPTEDKIDDVDKFYMEFEPVFDKFPKEIFLGDFSVEVSREDIFKPTTENETFHEVDNRNGAGAENFASSKNLTSNNPTS